MLDLHEDDGEVVDEQEGVHHGVGVLHDVDVLDPPLLLVEHPDAVEQPEGKDEHKQEDADASPEQVYPWHSSPRAAPGAPVRVATSASQATKPVSVSSEEKGP